MTPKIRHVCVTAVIFFFKIIFYSVVASKTIKDLIIQRYINNRHNIPVYFHLPDIFNNIKTGTAVYSILLQFLNKKGVYVVHMSGFL